MKPLIIPVFVPHAGCPNICVFCNQREVTCRDEVPGADIVDSQMELFLSSQKKRTEQRDTKPSLKYPQNIKSIEAKIGIPEFDHDIREIAFFGGSFTGIDLNIQESFLEKAQKWISKGVINGIRISTRPDLLDEKTITFLKDYNVTTVEIGAQSFCDKVLEKAKRGHSAKTTVASAKLVSFSGLRLGIQLMMGLPGEKEEDFIESVSRAIALNADAVRIYPVTVLPDTELMKMYLHGKYSPLTLEEVVTRGAKALRMLYDNKIPCIRFGLPENPISSNSQRIGPFHPAMKHLVDSRLAYATMSSKISKIKYTKGEEIFFLVPPSEVSVFKGIRKENIKKAESNYSIICRILPQKQA